MILKLLILSAFAALFQCTVQAQILSPDSLVSLRLQAAKELIRPLRESNYDYVNGQIVSWNYNEAKSPPYFSGSGWLIGNVEFTDGSVHRKLSLRYDIFRDQLQLLHHSRNLSQAIALNPEKLRSFEVNAFRFINITTDEAAEFGLPASGIYEMAYEGRSISCLYKWNASFIKATVNTAAYFESDRQIYIQKAGRYVRIRSIGGLKKLLPEQKAKIKAFYRDHPFTLRNTEDNSLVMLLNYCDTY